MCVGFKWGNPKTMDAWFGRTCIAYVQCGILGSIISSYFRTNTCQNVASKYKHICNGNTFQIHTYPRSFVCYWLCCYFVNLSNRKASAHGPTLSSANSNEFARLNLQKTVWLISLHPLTSHIMDLGFRTSRYRCVLGFRKTLFAVLHVAGESAL